MSETTTPTRERARRPIAATLAYYVGFITLERWAARPGSALPGAGATGIIAGCNQTRNKRRARLRRTRGSGILYLTGDHHE